MTSLTDLDKLHEAATPSPWLHWIVTTGLQECPDGEHRALIHGSGPPHERDGYGETAIDAAVADANLIQALRNAWPAISKALRAGKAFLNAIDRHADSSGREEPAAWQRQRDTREAFRAALKELEGK